MLTAKQKRRLDSASEAAAAGKPIRVKLGCRKEQLMELLALWAAAQQTYEVDIFPSGDGCSVECYETIGSWRFFVS